MVVKIVIMPSIQEIVQPNNNNNKFNTKHSKNSHLNKNGTHNKKLQVKCHFKNN